MKSWGQQSLLSSGALAMVQATWSVLLGLIATPMLVHGLGVAGYGIYALAFTIAGLGSYLDFGLGWTTSKFVAEADARRDACLLASTIQAATLYNLAIGVVVLAIIVPAAPWFAGVLQVSPSEVQPIIRVLRIASVSFLFASLGGVFINSLRGMRRFATASAISLISLTTSTMGAAFASERQMGLIAASVFQTSGAVLGTLLGAAAINASFFSPKSVPVGRRMQEMLRFSVWSYLNRLTQMFMFEIDKLLVGRFAGAGFLTFYSIPFGVAQRVAFIGVPAVTAIYPAAAAGQLDRERFIKQYFRGSRLVHVLTAAVAVTVIFWSDRLLLVWLGPQMARLGSFFLRVFAVAFWVSAVGSFDGSCVEGWNKPRRLMILVVVAVLTGFTAGFAMYPYLGVPRAVALAILLAQLLIGSGQIVLWQHLARYPWNWFFRKTLVPVIEMTAAALLLAFVLRPVLTSRAAVFGGLPLITAVVALLGASQAFDRHERNEIVGRVLLWRRPGKTKAEAELASGLPTQP